MIGTAVTAFVLGMAVMAVVFALTPRPAPTDGEIVLWKCKVIAREKVIEECRKELGEAHEKILLQCDDNRNAEAELQSAINKIASREETIEARDQTISNLQEALRLAGETAGKMRRFGRDVLASAEENDIEQLIAAANCG